jgi:hypothetical protein
VELRWDGGGLHDAVGAAVERCGVDGGWKAIGAPLADGPDRMSFVDTSAGPGRWGYRLRIPAPAEDWLTAEAWVDVPAPEMWVRALPTGAAGRRLRVEFQVPRAGAARIQLFDTMGRVVATRDLGVVAMGPRSEEVDATRLPAGLYWVRLRHAERSVEQRVVLLR